MTRLEQPLAVLFLCLFLFASGCASSEKDIRAQIAQDIAFRIERDFYNDDSESHNVEKILSDCVFEKVDLTGNGKNEYIVKFNWFSDGRFGIAKGHNYVRGVQDQGELFVYAVKDKKAVFLGTIGGTDWKTIPSSGRFFDIETTSHGNADRGIITLWGCSTGTYETILSDYFQLDENGNVIRLGASREIWPTLRPTDLLPMGARVAMVDHIGDDCKNLYKQDAVYEADIDGDGKEECLVIWHYPKGDPDWALHVTILRNNENDGIPDYSVIKSMELPGTYLCGLGLTDAEPVRFMKLEGEKNPVVIISTACSASVGARLSVLSMGGKEKGDYHLSTREETFHWSECTPKGFRLKDRYSMEWTNITVKRNKEGVVVLEPCRE